MKIVTQGYGTGRVVAQGYFQASSPSPPATLGAATLGTPRAVTAATLDTPVPAGG